MAKDTLSSVKALTYLRTNKDTVEIVGAVIKSRDGELFRICRENQVRLLTEEELKNMYADHKLEADYIFSFYWKRIGKDILSIPIKGGINFHPGPLPEARGSGYHMAILENWGYFGVTAHFMDEEFDTGPIIECRRFQISDKCVNKDLVRITHENLFLLFRDTVEKILSGNELETAPQQEGNYYSLPDLEECKNIKENESSEDIDRKIRAFWNPPYSGAQIEIKGKKYTIINEEILNWIDQNIKKS
jgi:methionyl-tRNA formyltransferase